jgi:5-(aminomethyl)-3-furanmethanol phosphate kinase
VQVVKLGGSLAQSGELRTWLAVLASAGAGRAVVVPGGGKFADAVRDAQREQGFDDVSAHRMALLAMEQYGLMLTGMEPVLVAAGDSQAIARALQEERVPVWMPSAMALGCADIPATWEATSDSLAAWLARALGASRLIVVKSVRFAQTRAAAGELVRHGWVDPMFPRLAANAGCPIRLLGSGDQAYLARMLDGAGPAGLDVLP